MQDDLGDEGGGDPDLDPGLGGDAPTEDEAQWATLEDVRADDAGDA